MRSQSFFAASLALSLSALLLAACEFRSHRAAWRLDTKVTYKVRYSAELRAKAEGSWGSSPYVSSARAEFSAQASGDTAKGQMELSLGVDTLEYRSPERGPEEDRYMTGRLRKYKAKLSLSRTGQVLSMEEEPGMPPVAFSPLNFGRFLAYALPAFPDAPVKKGSHWEVVQPLLDKFHPDSKVIKRYTLSAIRETPDGDLATCLVDLDAYLDEDLGDGAPAPATAGSPEVKPTWSGTGRVIFNLAKGRPVSAELEMEGRFTIRLPPKSGDSTQPAAEPMHMQEKLEIHFTD